MALNIVLHKEILTKILKDIYADISLASFLGFKGGTAASFFYELDRFSIDLDFDLLDVSQEGFIFEKVRDIISRFGKIKEARKKRFNLFYLLSYEEKKSGAPNIKVEINRRDFGSKYAIHTYLGISMKVMVQEDMIAHKMVAMYERIGRTNRDIYDVWFFLDHHWSINDAIITQRTKMPFKVFVQRCIDVLGTVDNTKILDGLGDLLTPKQKIWAKAHLLEDAIFNLRLLLDNIERATPTGS